MRSGAGYPVPLRELVAQATFPQHRAGGALAEEKLGQLAEAVKLLAEAGLDAEHLRELIATCQTRDGARWRNRFWRTTFAIAARRASQRR